MRFKRDKQNGIGRKNRPVHGRSLEAILNAQKKRAKGADKRRKRR